ncbi:hypothetical protein D7I44_11295 [Gryllotalpicola protaetiae]|uniref:Uncharacterized protein n=2 Tax=Gryllotalpicola protaetiae TaxID=2419771 RepID=A0A387BIZ3_9MICO|nr:hypothetical protein D7I44_11295 [Gryllotalpicola protaetiae]
MGLRGRLVNLQEAAYVTGSAPKTIRNYSELKDPTEKARRWPVRSTKVGGLKFVGDDIACHIANGLS